MHCPAEDAAHLASIARGICPFPDYTPSPLFSNMLSINSSLHLKNHYRGVQSSLNPQQLEDFTKSLRTTFGREGKVTLGGVGVVALSLAVLFDTLAKRAKGEWVPDSGPIPGLFMKDLRGYYPPHVYTISEYLRLVPHIANNPTRMREETERYIKQLIIDGQSLDKLGGNHTFPIDEDITVINWMLGQVFTHGLQIHLLRITNSTADEVVHLDGGPSGYPIINFNCDPETADKEFLAAVQKSDNSTKEAFKRCKPSGNVDKTWLHHVAKLEWLDVIVLPISAIREGADPMIAQSEDFDLKVTERINRK